jgi:hypothetical protein
MNNQTTQIEAILKNLKNDKEISPNAAFRTNSRIRILNTVINTKTTTSIPHSYSVPMVYAFRFALLLVFLFGSTVYAAQSSSPHDVLYPVKTLSEQVALTLSPTESTKTSVAMTIISRRADEHTSAEKAGDTEEIKQTTTNFESAVVEIRKTKHINREKVEIEIRKHESPSRKENDTKEDNNTTLESIREQEGQKPVITTNPKQSSPAPEATGKESSDHEDSKNAD